MSKAFKSKPRGTCPHCEGSLGIDPGLAPRWAVCPGCAAIATYEARSDSYRMLATEEWLSILGEPGYWDLLEERQRVVERITAPAERTNSR